MEWRKITGIAMSFFGLGMVMNLNVGFVLMIIFGIAVYRS